VAVDSQAMRCESWFLIIAMLSFSTADAQKQLSFKKGSRVAYYETGDVISYRLVGGRSKITGQIESFSDSTVVFRNYEVDLRDISHIYVDNKTKKWFAHQQKYEKLLLVAGFGYLMLDVINSGELTPDTKWISFSLIGAGLATRLLITDKFRIKGRKRLAIVERILTTSTS
jgi:hypothetical protein